MPQDTRFNIPFPHYISPDLESSRIHNSEWVKEYSLVTTSEARDWYDSWDMPKLAAYIYPFARREDLDLGCDIMAFFFLFDDQFDGPLGQRPDQVATVCTRLIECIHDSSGARSKAANPCERAFADIWHRSRLGSDLGWCARASHWWEYYFASYVHESLNRSAGAPISMEQYLQVRRGMAATDLSISIGERVSRVDVPPVAFHSPQLRIMRRIAADVPFMCNDVYSVEKEAARGDLDNMVLVIEHERNVSRATAVEEIVQKVDIECQRFRTLAQELAAMFVRLNLPEGERAGIRNYIDVMAAWMRGFQEWQIQTLRYRTAMEVVPSHAPGYIEELFGAQQPDAGSDEEGS
ncbi:terpene synthase family protein [Nocardia otitidiscaviarum]|uniref:terpene synthase family protein n=1 Tax=Nocardia otitidiscaviarum TaxID=1823 RepID=UPI002456D34B|nr:hypothetical protein [Nocardia otitidiscaviarum]